MAEFRFFGSTYKRIFEEWLSLPLGPHLLQSYHPHTSRSMLQPHVKNSVASMLLSLTQSHPLLSLFLPQEHLPWLLSMPSAVSAAFWKYVFNRTYHTLAISLHFSLLTCGFSEWKGHILYIFAPSLSLP